MQPPSDHGMANSIADCTKKQQLSGHDNTSKVFNLSLSISWPWKWQTVWQTAQRNNSCQAMTTRQKSSIYHCLSADHGNGKLYGRLHKETTAVRPWQHVKSLQSITVYQLTMEMANCMADCTKKQQLSGHDNTSKVFNLSLSISWPWKWQTVWQTAQRNNSCQAMTTRQKSSIYHCLSADHGNGKLYGRLHKETTAVRPWQHVKSLQSITVYQLTMEMANCMVDCTQTQDSDWKRTRKTYRTTWMGDCYVLGFASTPEIFPESNSLQTLQKSFTWDHKLKSPMCTCMQKDYIHTLKILYSMSKFGGL